MKESKPINFENERIKDGFQPDASYFEALESGLFEKLDVEEEFNGVKDGYSASEEYFNYLENSVFEKVGVTQNKNVKKSSKVISIFRSKTIWMAAASIAVIISLTLWKSLETAAPEMTFADLSIESEQWYLSQNELFLTDNDLSYLLSDEVYEIEIQDEDLEKELENYILEYGLYSLE